MKWVRCPPDTAGWWLRINAVGRPVIHHVFMFDGLLCVRWGQAGALPIGNDKLDGWSWCKIPSLAGHK